MFLLRSVCMVKKSKSFDEYWAEEDAVLKMSLEVSRRNKQERLNKSPGKKLIDVIEGRVNNREKSDDSTTQTSDSEGRS